MSLYLWSQTASSNASADPSINWAEGMPPSAVDDSARAMMAAIARYRDDTAGAIVTGGTVNAYTVTSNQGFDSLAHFGGNVIAFSPHITNTGACQINVDGLGLKGLRPSPGVDFVGGELVQGTPYSGIYSNADGVVYVHGYYANPYSIPFLGGVDYWDTVAPNSSFIFPQGQAISRTTYSRAFARWGTTFGSGNGTTTFNVPDKTGRVSAMLEASATRLTSTYFGGNSTAMGAVGGLESQTLTTAQLAIHSHANTLTDNGHTHSGTVNLATGSGASSVAQTSGNGGPGTTENLNINSSTTGITINNASAGSGNAHNNVQPTIVCNYIIRII